MMPDAPPMYRPPGTRNDAQRARQRKRAYDRQRRETQPFRRWYNLALWQRRRAHQLASEPLCRVCAAAGKVTPATIADHVIPHRGDWTLFAGGELQSLCKFHHDSTKQAAEEKRQGVARPEWLKPSAVPLTIVTGPPAGGKNTYVDQHAAPGDLIIDLDMIAADLSGHHGHDWDRRWLGPALHERNRCSAVWRPAVRARGARGSSSARRRPKSAHGGPTSCARAKSWCSRPASTFA